MRHRSERVRALITDDVIPRTPSGGIALCHDHQRMVMHYGGLIKYLLRRLRCEASGMSWYKGIIAACPKCHSVTPYYISTRHVFKCRDCHHQYTADSNGRYRCRKLPLQKINDVAAALLSGESGLSVSKRFGVSIKSVYKIRDRARD
jgi:transposase-like protein